MGKGDKKTKKGKIAKGTFGRLRPKRDRSSITTATAKPKAKKKPATKAKPKPKAKEKDAS